MWIANYGCPKKCGYTLLDKNGNINLKRYRATFDYSLDLIKLREIYLKVYRNGKFSYKKHDKEYSSRIINVTFNYSVKPFNRAGDNIYLRYDSEISNVVWRENLGYVDGEIVAVKTGKEISENAHVEDLPKYFYIEKNQYKIKPNLKIIETTSNIRKKLYRDGFYTNGTHYIRWKRSSGSARVGKCLFIDEKLYKRMHAWEMCGLQIKDGQKVDLAALESYISLTSSSIIDTLPLKPHNFLIVEDYDSKFYDKVINVAEKDKSLVAKNETIEICNSIWDGQSLIDMSAMGKYRDKGMILLRNRFFKSCCFNANIQKWFLDNNISDISQLNGFTLAKNIEDIKIITTPNSIKYLKFSTIEKWLDLLEPDFGVVKYEKPTHFMGGELVQTHYQLLNSLQMSQQEVNEFLEPTFNFMSLVKNDPTVLRHWIKFKIENEIEITPLISKTDVVYKLMSLNEKFYETKLYYDFKTDFLKSFTKEIKCGHILVNGNYSTLCGNPIEMLQSSIGLFEGESVVEKNCFYSTRFDWGKTLLGSRSPHPTISNSILKCNKYNFQIDTYMNTTNEIVYINSIDENILQQAAGSDFDSDSILLTDNYSLVNCAKRNYEKFKVGVCNVDGIKVQRKYTTEDKSDLDIKTSKNLIGEIINAAQELNSQIWDRINRGETYKDIEEIYLDTCKLSILSGIEIDKAKKEFSIDSAKELIRIRNKHRLEKDSKIVKPNFFAHISRQKGYYNPHKKNYLRHKTTMDYLQYSINSFRSRRMGKKKNLSFLPFSEIVDKTYFEYMKVKDKQIVKILNEVDNLNRYISNIYSDTNLSATEKHAESSFARQNFIEYIGGIKFNDSTMIALLQSIEKEENKKYRRLLFYTLFGYPNASFYDVLIKSKESLEKLEENSCGNIEIFGHFMQKINKNR